MHIKDINVEQLSPMMKEYIKTKMEVGSDCLLLYRLGDFYEIFFEDAELCSKELEITLTGKQCGLEERAPMCGVPFHAVDGYVNKLIKKGYKVAICDQVEDPKLKWKQDIWKDLNKKIKDVLTEFEYQVFELLISGFKYKEIASILDKDGKSIDNAIQRLKVKIKEIIKSNK